MLASPLISCRDTVASVGLLYGRNLPFTTNNDAIRVFRHALSLDEVRIHYHRRDSEHPTSPLQHRARFQPNLFHRESPDEESAKKDPEHASRANTSDMQSCPPEDAKTKRSRPGMTTWKMTVRRLSEMERYRAAERRSEISSRSRTLIPEHPAVRKTEMGLLQSVEEVWFAGCHSDVGGEHPTLHHKLSSLIPTVTLKRRSRRRRLSILSSRYLPPVDGQASHILPMRHPFRSRRPSEGRYRHLNHRRYGSSPAHRRGLLEQGGPDTQLSAPRTRSRKR